jgi:hypothetical protein
VGFGSYRRVAVGEGLKGEKASSGVSNDGKRQLHCYMRRWDIAAAERQGCHQVGQPGCNSEIFYLFDYFQTHSNLI